MHVAQVVLATLSLVASRYTVVQAATSRRAKCAVDCYTKCVSSGTPKAVYCNCPLSIEQQPCNSVNEDLIQKSLMKDAKFEAETHYKDVRTVSIRMQPYNGAFIYIFEYSTVSVDNDNWIFAGASSSPQITFAVPDACRDYQFRVLVVVRSTDPFRQLVVFPPKSIPVALPSFAVPPESIRLDEPRQSSDNQSLHVFVSWHNPKGYDDADIYGYESPVAYPIRCMTPEDRLSQPRVELVEGGARMHLSLPIEVLQERCRIYMEVRMIPRCVRIENFDIQASVELDCDKFATLDYCRKEMNPQCADIVDVWGKDGKVMVVWQQPHRDKPQFYIVNFGVAQTTGALPFVTRKLSSSEEIKVPGNVTHVELNAEPGVHYGLQICGIYSEGRTKSPFNIVPVIPFMCQKCKKNDINCIDCTKEEDAETMLPLECNGRSCVYNNLTNRFVPLNAPSSNTLRPVKDTFSAVTPLSTIEGNALNPQQRHSKIVKTDLAIPLNISQLTFERPHHVPTTKSHKIHNTATEGASTLETTTESSHHLELPEFEAINTVGLPPRDDEELPTTRAIHLPTRTTDSIEDITKTSREHSSLTIRPGASGSVQQIDIETMGSSLQSTTIPFIDFTTSTVQSSTSTDTKEFASGEQKSVDSTDEEQDIEPKHTEPLKSTSSLAGRVDFVPVSSPEETTLTTVPTTEGPDSDATTEDDRSQKDRSTSKGHTKAGAGAIRLHQKGALTSSSNDGKSCKQRSGIICEYGCMDDVKCNCPNNELTCIRGIMCPIVNDLRAVYENSSRTLKLYSTEIAALLRQASAYDKVYLELGELMSRRQKLGQDHSYAFSNDASKEHVMLSIKDLDSAAIFESMPYILNVRKELRVGEKTYGLSVCVLNSSLVPIIQDNVFMDQTVFNENSISPFTQTLLSPVELSEEGTPKAATYRGFLIFIGPAFLVFGVIIFGLVVACVTLVRRRRRTPVDKFRHLGLLGDQSRHRFTSYRPGSLGGSTTITPANFYNDNTARYYMNRNVHF